ncbi:acetyl-CoA carboxylase biotin carboxyl carrier protein subunit [Edaphobacillus lindanitolerans]|uniref:Acetyl-CoA carboxylase biotin carboxyl carrier protein n=1 Tax=Edaphobacillus lindanitolerans TaxID=550447 RepID=A0A1U7PHI2_9BACI|nr:acetyl-CoA carboxylase biotin carboxyl carrier protein subunit [Edaphobacillus lindanitolerans]SIT67906.1 acetyl-CoA carboxylase biotin carboxyl carrier protein [Edaphobacillus lindanitolerans]
MNELKSTMAGTVFTVDVTAGDEVAQGQAVIVLESMKMEIPVEAEKGGKVKEVRVDVGDFVNEGDVILTFE